jgi:hypothetical protein
VAEADLALWHGKHLSQQRRTKDHDENSVTLMAGHDGSGEHRQAYSTNTR